MLSPTAILPRRKKAPGVAFAALSLVIIGALLNGALVDRYDEDAEVGHQRQLRSLDPKTVGPMTRERNAQRIKRERRQRQNDRRTQAEQQQVQLQDEPQSPSPDVAEDDSYIVLLSCSHGFFDMYVNWLKFFQKLDIPNLPVHLFAEDEVTYDKCLEQVASSEYESVDLTCLPWDFVFDHGQAEDQDSGAAMSHNTRNYKMLVSRRPAIVKRELELGRNVLYSDIDIVWLKDPMPYIRDEFRRLDNDGSGKGEAHILAQGDYGGWQKKKNTQLCTGFVAYRPRAATIAFVDLWMLRLERRPGLNQGPFNKLLGQAAASDIGLRAEILPQGLFVSGKLYFEVMTEEQRKKAVVAHNNWIVGYDPKLDRFKEFGLWLVEE